MRLRAFVALAVISGCGKVLGADFDEVRDPPGAGGAGAAGGNAGSGATSGGTSGSGGVSGSGGASGAAGAQADAAQCEPGTTAACYEGALGTLDVGVCHGGSKACTNAATYGACEGQVLPASVDCKLDALDTDCDAHTGEHIWSRRLGDGGLQRLRDATLDSADNVLLTGYAWSPIPLTAQQVLDPEIFLIKLDAAGNVAWGKAYKTYGSEGIGVATTSNQDVVLNALLTGTTNFGGQDLTPPAGQKGSALAKLDKNGAHVWSRLAPAFVSRIDGAGDQLLVAGGYAGTLSWPNAAPIVNDGSWDLYVALLDAGGNALWVRSFDGNAEVSQMAVDSKGNIIVVGKTNGGVDFGGGWAQISGLVSFIAKLDPTGKPLWSKSLGPAPQFVGAASVDVAADDSIWLAAPFLLSFSVGPTDLFSQGAEDVAVVRFAPDGTPIFVRQYGGSGADLPSEGSLDASGNFVIGGTTNGSIGFGTAACSIQATPCQPDHAGCFDAFLLKLDPGGEPMWAHASGDAIDDGWEGWPGEVFVSVDIASDDSIVGSGYFSGLLDWSDSSAALISAGDHDLFVSRFAR